MSVMFPYGQGMPIDKSDKNTPATQTFMAKVNASLCPPVFYTSAIAILALVVSGILAPETMEGIFKAAQEWVLNTFGWYYLLIVGIFLVVCVWLALSRFGSIRLGPDNIRPDYGYITWFSMLFSAGMGIGLMFFGVAEPMMHYASPPQIEGGTPQAAKEAMTLSIFHWGIQAWAIYAIIALALAYFSFRKGKPLSIRSALYPLFGKKMDGPLGHAVDTFAIISTMFGVATSLGLGAMQVNRGLEELFGLSFGISSQSMIIAFITLCATVSVVLGLDKGIKRLSNFNMILAVVLLGFVIIAGPTLHILEATVQNTGEYLSRLIQLTLNTRTYAVDEQARGWLNSWTIFYWAWWIAWAPFVGMFIARISKGRTIKEFMVGVLLVPVGFTVIWFSAFGNTAILFDQTVAGGAISEAVTASIDTALFNFLDYLPLSFAVSIFATILVVTFFVTSSDSGSLVIDILASGGKNNPAVWQRIFWAISEGLVAAVLLLAGGLAGLQTASIVAALPFSAIMLLMCAGLIKSLYAEKPKHDKI